MSVNRIEIKGFKSIKELDIDLNPINVLIGPNGSGKSNFIQVFKLLNSIAEEKLQSYVAKSGGNEAILHFGQKETDLIYLAIESKPNKYSCVLAPTTENSGLFFENEVCYFRDENNYEQPYSISLGSGHLETQLHDYILGSKHASVPKYVLKVLRQWKIYHFHDTSDSSKLRKPCNINDNSIFKPDGSNLPAFLSYLEKYYKNYYINVRDAIRMVAPWFHDFRLKPMRLNEDLIQLEWSHVDSDDYFNANSLSDGTLRFICLAVLFLQPILPSTILLDEPELGLHPFAISLLASMIRSASTQTQIIISTQSVTFVNQFEPEDIVVVERENGVSSFQRLKREYLEKWLDEYGIGELWEKNILGGRPG